MDHPYSRIINFKRFAVRPSYILSAVIRISSAYPYCLELYIGMLVPQVFLRLA